MSLIFSDDFESGSLNATNWSNSYNAVVESSLKKTGNYALNVSDDGYAQSESGLNLTDFILSFW